MKAEAIGVVSIGAAVTMTRRARSTRKGRCSSKLLNVKKPKTMKLTLQRKPERTLSNNQRGYTRECFGGFKPDIEVDKFTYPADLSYPLPLTVSEHFFLVFCRTKTIPINPTHRTIFGHRSNLQGSIVPGNRSVPFPTFTIDCDHII